ncbi:MAG: CBS domain-containing protein [Bdellovibrionota bacterium]
MIKDIIQKNLVTCEPDAHVDQVAKIMDEKNVGCVMVLDNNKPRGLITDRDIVLRCIAKNVDVNDCTVEQVMSDALDVAKETDGIYDVIQKMQEKKVRRMPVVDGRGHAVGIVTFSDLVSLLAKEFYQLTNTMAPTEEEEDRGYTDEMAA